MLFQSQASQHLHHPTMHRELQEGTQDAVLPKILDNETFKKWFAREEESWQERNGLFRGTSVSGCTEGHTAWLALLHRRNRPALARSEVQGPQPVLNTHSTRSDTHGQLT